MKVVRNQFYPPSKAAPFHTHEFVCKQDVKKQELKKERMERQEA